MKINIKKIGKLAAGAAFVYVGIQVVLTGANIIAGQVRK